MFVVAGSFLRACMPVRSQKEHINQVSIEEPTFCFDQTQLFKQFVLGDIDGIPLDAVKIHTDGNLNPIHLQWVPSYVDLLGNEVVDDLAKVVTSDLFCGPGRPHGPYSNRDLLQG
ncbi:hypothetical protein TNCV_3578491 [Trichonephila clavipes]|nr:hypothetical protein TNCV_3578491 [Trichonephila clavipes]